MKGHAVRRPFADTSAIEESSTSCALFRRAERRAALSHSQTYTIRVPRPLPSLPRTTLNNAPCASKRGKTPQQSNRLSKRHQKTCYLCPNSTACKFRAENASFSRSNKAHATGTSRGRLSCAVAMRLLLRRKQQRSRTAVLIELTISDNIPSNQTERTDVRTKASTAPRAGEQRRGKREKWGTHKSGENKRTKRTRVQLSEQNRSK
jgi:hypothetical protein